MIRPNIVYIHSHDTGRYIQPYGYAARTPHLQRLAEEGVLFRQAFSAAPTCSPSRASLLTGQWPHCNGMLGLAHLGHRLNDYRQHIIHTLHDAGYTSVLAGSQHIAWLRDDWEGSGPAPGADVSEIGYHEILPGPHAGVHDAHEAVIEFLARPPQQPFFLAVGFGETHRNFPEPSPENDPRYTLPPAPLPDTPETRAEMAAYNTMATTLDRKIGAVLQALQEAGLADNTLVICTTDHGLAFPAMKCNLTDHGIGVSLIMRGGDEFRGGKVIDAMVSQLDVFPTVCDLIGIERPAWLQGESMLPLLRGDVNQIHDEIFAEVNYHAGYEPMRAVRTDRWKYIRGFEDREGIVFQNCEDCPSKDLWLDAGWQSQPRPAEMLYDLMFDPHETNNLVGQPQAQVAYDDMRRRLDQWMHNTDDPLLNGYVPRPEGSLVCDPDIPGAGTPLPETWSPG